jgi:hypothetical protein
MDDFNDATHRFLAWFKAGGGKFQDDLLEIQDLRARDAGRGISGFSLRSVTTWELTACSRKKGYTGRYDAIYYT